LAAEVQWLLQVSSRNIDELRLPISPEKDDILKPNAANEWN